MIWKAVLLLLGAVLLAALVCPATLSFSWDGALTLRLRVLGIPFRLWPRPAKQEGKGKKKAPPSSREPSPPGEEKPSPVKLVLDHLETVRLLVEQGERFWGRAVRAVTLHHLRLWMTVAGEDPAQTGIRFGRANALAYGLLALLQRNFRVRDARLDIRPNFLPGGEDWAQGEGKLTACPVVLLWAAIRLAAGVLPLLGPFLPSKGKPSPQGAKRQQPEEKAV